MLLKPSMIAETRERLSAKDWRAMRANPSASGVTVTPQTAMTFSAYFSAIRIIAETVAMLPLFTYRRSQPHGKEQALQHPLFTVLHDVANPEMDAYVYRETVTAHLAGWGKGISEIEFDGAGRIAALWPLPPNAVTVLRDPKSRELVYEITLSSGETKYLPAYRILHLRGLSFDGINSYSVAKLAKESIGLGLAAEEFGARFFANDASPGVVLTHPNTLDDDAYDRMTKSWKEMHEGLSNKHRMALLEEGVTVEKIGIPPEDAQFLQTRAFQVEEIARWFRLPPTMLAMSDKAATYASVEAFGLQFVNYTLYPWLVRWEKGGGKQLLLPRERPEYFIEHLMTALLRGDAKARNEAYHIQWMDGVINADEWRGFENQNPQRDGVGQIYWVPANMQPVDKARLGQPSKKEASATRSGLLEPLYLDVFQRIIRREAHDVAEAVRKTLAKGQEEKFTEWLAQFYGQDHPNFMTSALMPVVDIRFRLSERSTSEDELREAALSMSLFHCAANREALTGLTSDQVTATLELWQAEQPRSLTERYANRSLTNEQ